MNRLREFFSNTVSFRWSVVLFCFAMLLLHEVSYNKQQDEIDSINSWIDKLNMIDNATFVSVSNDSTGSWIYYFVPNITKPDTGRVK